MRITALPAAFHRAANNRPPELSQIAADRLKILEQWPVVRVEASRPPYACGRGGAMG